MRLPEIDQTQRAPCYKRGQGRGMHSHINLCHVDTWFGVAYQAISSTNRCLWCWQKKATCVDVPSYNDPSQLARLVDCFCFLLEDCGGDVDGTPHIFWLSCQLTARMYVVTDIWLLTSMVNHYIKVYLRSRLTSWVFSSQMYKCCIMHHWSEVLDIPTPQKPLVPSVKLNIPSASLWSHWQHVYMRLLVGFARSAHTMDGWPMSFAIEIPHY